MEFRVFLLSFILVSGTVAIVSNAQTAPELSKWESSLLRISLREDNSLLDQGSSTAIVVDNGGYLVTSLRKLAPAIRNPENIQIYVHLPEGPVLAQIERIDAATDICLLRVARSLPSFVNFEEGKKTMRLFIFGFMENGKLGFVEGSSIGETIFWGQSSLQISTFASPEMRGGLVVNESGIALGMLQGGTSNSVASMSFSADLKKIVSEKNSVSRELASDQSILQRFASQIAKRQKSFVKAEERIKSYRPMKYGAYSFKLPLAEGGCRKEKSGALMCTSGKDLSLDKSLLISKSEWWISSTPASYSKSPIFGKDEDMNRAIASLTSEPQCEAKRVKNRLGISLEVRFCASALPGKLGLYNSELKVQTAKSRDFYLRYTLWGVSLEATSTFAEDLIESLKYGVE